MARQTREHSREKKDSEETDFPKSFVWLWDVDNDKESGKKDQHMWDVDMQWYTKYTKNILDGEEDKWKCTRGDLNRRIVWNATTNSYKKKVRILWTHYAIKWIGKNPMFC